MRGEHAGVVMPVTPRPGHQRGEPVEQLERGEGELGLAGGVLRSFRKRAGWPKWQIFTGTDMTEQTA
jgi:hypothetical protein